MLWDKLISIKLRAKRKKKKKLQFIIISHVRFIRMKFNCQRDQSKLGINLKQNCNTLFSFLIFAFFMFTDHDHPADREAVHEAYHVTDAADQIPASATNIILFGNCKI